MNQVTATRKKRMRGGFASTDLMFTIAAIGILVGIFALNGRNLFGKIDIQGNIKAPAEQIVSAIIQYRNSNYKHPGSFKGLNASTLAPYVNALKHDNTTPPGFITNKAGSGDVKFTMLPHNASTAGTNNRAMIFLDCSQLQMDPEEKLAAEEQFASIIIQQSPGAYILGTATSMPSAAAAKSTTAHTDVDNDCRVAAVNVR